MTKIDIFRNFRRFSTNLQLFQNFSKLNLYFRKTEILENFDRNRMFRKFDQNRNFSKLSQILTNTEFFSKVSPKSNPPKIWPKSKFFENYDQIRNFFENFDQNPKFFQKFGQNWNFFEKLIKIEIEKIEIFRKFDSNRNLKNPNFSKILTKIELFFSKMWPKSNFFEILTKIEFFSNIWPISKFFEKFHQNRNFRKFQQNRKFFENLIKIGIFPNFRRF